MSLPHLIALLLALHVALSDLHARRVSNRALLLALGGGAAALALPHAGLSPIPALLGLVLGLAALLPFHALRWMGAGDVKFFATLGFLLGWQALLPIWIVASLLAGLHAGAVLAAKRLSTGVGPHWLPARAADTLAGWRQQALDARQGRAGAPYAAFLALGAALTILVPGMAAHG